jgi:Lrp/AsnC family transcriptional regulator for asnA, asnC and gidA
LKAERPKLDEADLSIIAELQTDGRRGVAELADTLNVHRNTVSVKLKRLIDKRVVTPAIYVRPPALGYNAAAVIGIKVAPGEIDAVIGLIQPLPNVHNVFVCLGRYQIILWGLFRDQDELHSFITKELGRAPGILGTETMVSLGIKKLSFALLDSPEPQQEQGDRTPEVPSASEASLSSGLDEQDCAIIRELQRDARQSAAAIARNLDMNRNTVLAKMRALLDQGVVKAFVVPNVAALGYQVMVAMGISVLPGDIDAASDRFKYLKSTLTLTICTGRYNIMLWSLFRNMDELYDLLRTELGSTPGIRDAEVMVILRVTKNSFAYLTSPATAESSDDSDAAPHQNRRSESNLTRRRSRSGKAGV